MTLTVGLDFGTKRIGIAVSDPDGQVAIPHSVLELEGDDTTDISKLVLIITELRAQQLVVGLPLSLNSGTNNDPNVDRANPPQRPKNTAQKTSADLAKGFATKLKEKLDINVVLHDERFSTVEADKKLKNIGMSSKQSRSKVDMVAATIILQSWLDKQAYNE